MALEDRRYGEQQARLGRMDQLALEDRQRAQEEAKYRRNMGFLDRGVVPEGVAEFKDPNPQEAFGRFGPNDPPPGWGEGAREYTSEGKIAANAQQALTQKMEPKPFYGRTEEQRIAAAEAARRFQTERDAASVAEKDRQNQIERINKQIDKLKTAQAAQMVPEVGADRPFWGTGDYTQAQIDALPGGAARKALQGQIDDLNVELRSLQSGAASALGGNAQPQPPKGDYKSRFVDKLKSRVTPDVQP
jgi:hypothetical protein